MRSLKKDKKIIYISKKLPSVPILDDDDNPTGEYAKVYDSPTLLKLNIKPISDKTERQIFGENSENILKISYTLYDSQGFEIENYSAVCLGTEPNGILTDRDFKNPMNNNYLVIKTINLGTQNAAYIKRISGAGNEN